MPSLNSQLQDTSKMLASVCVWLEVSRISEQWEDARVLGTLLESAWSPLPPSCPQSRLQHRASDIDSFTKFPPPAPSHLGILCPFPEAILPDLSCFLQAPEWLLLTACPLLVYLWPFWVLEETSLGLCQ